MTLSALSWGMRYQLRIEPALNQSFICVRSLCIERLCVRHGKGGALDTSILHSMHSSCNSAGNHPGDSHRAWAGVPSQ